MGLDMYLTGERYLWSFPENNPDRSIAESVRNLFPELKGKEVKSVRVEMGYWRKANQIHKWFVDNCQNGVDECQETYVGTEKLAELLNTCRAVLAGRGTAAGEANARAMLPTQGGFFFGSTEYDDYYWDDIEHTVKLLEGIVNNEELKGWDFYYRSSW